MRLSFGISGPLSIIMSVTSIGITVVTIAVMGLSVSRPFAIVMTIVMGIRVSITMAIVTIMRLSGCGRLRFSSGSGFSISLWFSVSGSLSIVMSITSIRIAV